MKASHRAYALLVLVFIVSFAYWIAGASALVGDLRLGQTRARLPFDFGFRMQAISGILPEAQQAGAHLGDRLLEFNERPFTGYRVMREAVSRAHPGSVIQAVIERPDGTRVPIAIRLAPQRLHPASVSEWILDIALQLAFPLRHFLLCAV
jgi:hypothetical protein